MKNPYPVFSIFLTLISLKYSTAELIRLPLSGISGQGYQVSLSIGSPQQQLNVVVDTGSSNLAIACTSNPGLKLKKYFHPENSTTFRSESGRIRVPYTEGRWEGYMGSDIISIQNFSARARFACIDQSQHFFVDSANWQGLLGLGNKAISKPDGSVTPVFDVLQTTNGLSDEFGVKLCKGINYHDSNGSVTTWNNGTLVFGGIDHLDFQGELLYASTVPSGYYQVVISDIQVNGSSLPFSCKEYNFDKTLVDTGTTNLRLPSRVYKEVMTLIRDYYEKSINNSADTDLSVHDQFWTSSNLACWKSPQAPFERFPVILIQLVSAPKGLINLKVTPQQYLRAVQTKSGSSTSICYKFSIIQNSFGTVIGAVVMEGAYYVHFNRSNKLIGFAQSSCALPALLKSQSDANSSLLSYQADEDEDDLVDYCTYKHYSLFRSEFVSAIAYSLLVVCLIFIIPVVVISIYQLVQKRRRKSWQRLDDQNSDVDDTTALRMTPVSTTTGL